jgi:ketosteroid isomerase-like protein
VRSYEAYRRGDLEGVAADWHDDIELTPLPGGRSYQGREDAHVFLTEDLGELNEFDFRVYTVLEQDEEGVIFGRYSIREGRQVVDKGIFWIAHVEDGKLISFQGFANVGEAFAVFRERVAAARAA